MRVIGRNRTADRRVSIDDARRMLDMRVSNARAARTVACLGAGVLLSGTLLIGPTNAIARAGQEGGETAAVSPAGNCGGGNTYWRSERDGDQRCPPTHGIAADVSWWNLRWRRWNRDQARGHGIAVHYDCTPRRCRWGKTGRVRVRLFRSRLCPDGRRIYTRISAVFYSSRYGTQRSRWSYYCKPRLTRRNGGGG
jgi:hypothetical protein